MKPSIRFLGLAIVGWASVRAASLGYLPNADMFHLIDSSEARPAPVAPIAATQFPTLEPIPAAEPMAAPADVQSPPAQPAAFNPVRYVQGLVGVPVSMGRGVVPVYKLPPPGGEVSADPLPRPTRLAYSVPTPVTAAFAPLPPLGDWPVSSLGGISHPLPPQSAPIDPHRLDRLQLSTWALLRSQQMGVAGSRSLATGGQLGASQAGARLVYNYSRQLAIAARLSSEVGRRGGEAALGLRVRPLVSVPVWITAERRQAIGQYGGGRNAFAFFVEGGLYGQPLPWNFSMDSYVQGGIVGLRNREWFVDGGLAVSRPVYKNFSAGFGVWGAAQQGLSRLDVGPRITMKVRNNLKVHFDWRQKLAGNARPGSGPAVTLAGDF